MKNIREAKVGDEKEIQSFIFKAVDPDNNPDFSEEGAYNFAKPNQLSSIRKRIISPDYLTLCYFVQEKLVGLITMHLYQKLDQLFVDAELRNMKIAKNLWMKAKENCVEKNTEKGNQHRFNVKSSTMAVPVYQSFGFNLDGSRQESNGIVFYPMSLTLSCVPCADKTK